MNSPRVEAFLKIGTYADYPWEDVMFRCDSEHGVFYMKRYGADKEEAIGDRHGILDAMLGMVSLSGLDGWEAMSVMGAVGGDPLTAEEYDLGKQRTQTILTAANRRNRREFFAFDQALYLNTSLSCEEYADSLGLQPQSLSKAPVVDWLTSATQPRTSIQSSASTGIHPAAEGQIDPNLELFWDEPRGVVDDPATYELQIELLVKAVKHQGVTGGLYVANSARAVWWSDTDGVTVTSDPEVLSSMPGQQIAPALQAAGIEYRNG